VSGILIKHIDIEKSLVVAGSYNLLIEDHRGYRYTGNFAANDLMHFAQAVSEAIKFFGAAHGLIHVEKDGTVRKVEQ
jgi:hypothetical protein